MGIGIVLFGWSLLCSCLGLPFAIGLGVWSWRWSDRKGWRSVLRAVAAAMIPYAAILVGLTWFFFYAWYSADVRGMDPGLGDSWVVPVGHNYFFSMIDVTDSGHLVKGSGSGSAEVNDIVQLAEVGSFIIGVHDNNRPFVFDLASGTLTHYPTLDEAFGQFSPPPKLQTPFEFYGERRTDWRDLAALLLLLCAELATIAVGYRLLIRRRRSKRLVADTIMPPVNQKDEKLP